MKTDRLLLFLFLILSIEVAAQQQYLLLKKKNTAKIFRVEVGDVVRVRTLKGETIKDRVLTLTDKSMQVGAESFAYEELEYIRTYNLFFKGLGRSLETGSLFLTGIFLVNGVITGAAPLISEGAFIAVGVVFATGVLLEWTSQRTHHVEEYRLELVQIPYE